MRDGLQSIIMYPYWLINYDKHTILMLDVNNRGLGVGHMGPVG